MNIHTYEKVWLGASMVLIIGLIATVTYGAVGVGITMIGDDGGTIDPNNLSDHPEFSDPGVTKIGPNEYEVHVIAGQFYFEPGTTDIFGPINVTPDSRVTFHVTSRDVIHSFSIVGTNANTMVIPGEISSFTVEFDEAGEYGILCNEFCGPGHHTMEGLIIVEERGGDS